MTGVPTELDDESNIAYEATINTSGNNFTVVPSVVRVEGLPVRFIKGVHGIPIKAMC